MPAQVPYRVLFRSEDWKDLVSIQQVYHATDDAGGVIVVVLTTAKNIECCVVNSSLKEADAVGRRGMEATHSITFHQNPEVRNDDRIIWEGRLLIVTGTNDEFGAGIIWTVNCREVVA